MSAATTSTIISKGDEDIGGQRSEVGGRRSEVGGRRLGVRFYVKITARQRDHIRKRFINCSRISIASLGFIRLSIFSRRSGSMAASSRTILSRVLHCA